LVKPLSDAVPNSAIARSGGLSVAASRTLQTGS
jgi:hypothetical protein